MKKIKLCSEEMVCLHLLISLIFLIIKNIFYTDFLSIKGILNHDAVIKSLLVKTNKIVLLS